MKTNPCPNCGERVVESLHLGKDYCPPESYESDELNHAMECEHPLEWVCTDDMVKDVISRASAADRQKFVEDVRKEQAELNDWVDKVLASLFEDKLSHPNDAPGDAGANLEKPERQYRHRGSWPAGKQISGNRGK